MPRSKSPISSSPKKSSADRGLNAAAQWSRIVDSIIRGDPFPRPNVVLGPTPNLLKRVGLSPVDLVMTCGKIARCRREHPEVELDTWHRLPELLCDPLAAVPSMRRDGSLVVMLVVSDRSGDPVVAAIAAGREGAPNVVLSLYGKANGIAWLTKQIEYAQADKLPYYARMDFAATMPQPGSAEAIPSSPGPIPADGTAKPSRNILSIRKDSTKS